MSDKKLAANLNMAAGNTSGTVGYRNRKESYKLIDCILVVTGEKLLSDPKTAISLGVVADAPKKDPSSVSEIAD